MTIENTIPRPYAEAEMIWWQVMQFRKGPRQHPRNGITSYFNEGIITGYCRRWHKFTQYSVMFRIKPQHNHTSLR